MISIIGIFDNKSCVNDFLLSFLVTYYFLNIKANTEINSLAF